MVNEVIALLYDFDGTHFVRFWGYGAHLLGSVHDRLQGPPNLLTIELLLLDLLGVVGRRHGRLLVQNHVQR